MFDANVSQRGLVVGMTRHEHVYGGYDSAEKVGSFEDLVTLGERVHDKSSLADFEPLLRPAQARDTSFARVPGYRRGPSSAAENCGKGRRGGGGRAARAGSRMEE
jgi:hypothetical protein